MPFHLSSAAQMKVSGDEGGRRGALVEINTLMGVSRGNTSDVAVF